jgi:hypothetical protein
LGRRRCFHLGEIHFAAFYFAVSCAVPYWAVSRLIESAVIKRERREEQPKPLPFTLQTCRGSVSSLLMSERQGYDEDFAANTRRRSGGVASDCSPPPPQFALGNSGTSTRSRLPAPIQGSAFGCTKQQPASCLLFRTERSPIALSYGSPRSLPSSQRRRVSVATRLLHTLSASKQTNKQTRGNRRRALYHRYRLSATTSTSCSPGSLALASRM